MAFNMKKKLSRDGLTNPQPPIKTEMLPEVDLGVVKNKKGGAASAKSLSLATLPTALATSGIKALKFGITKATKPLKEKFTRNINPYGYEGAGGGILERVKSALQEPEQGSIASFEEYEDWQKQEALDPESEYNMLPQAERQDLLSMMMTGEQKHGTIPVSKYKPTKAKDKDVTYYSSPSTERSIKAMLELNKGYEDELVLGQEYGDVLGNYSLSRGEDEKGKYIAYYDVWDLNPYRGRSEKLDAVTTLGQYLAGVKPAEIYGRVYY